jgi:hypothetical protein
MKQQSENFKGVWIPKRIWKNKNLSLLERCLIAEVDALCDSETGKDCYASNTYLAEFFNKSTSVISHAITKLCREGYLERDIIKAGTGKITRKGLRLGRNAAILYVDSSDAKNSTVAKISNGTNAEISNGSNAENSHIYPSKKEHSIDNIIKDIAPVSQSTDAKLLMDFIYQHYKGSLITDSEKSQMFGPKAKKDLEAIIAQDGLEGAKAIWAFGWNDKFWSDKIIFPKHYGKIRTLAQAAHEKHLDNKSVQEAW